MIWIMLIMGGQLQSSLYSNCEFEQNMRKLKKNNEKFSYPHPILKSFSSIPQQSLNAPPHAYQNFHTSDPKTISNKILQSTHINPLLGSSFSLLLHPLHPGVEVDRFSDRSMLHCNKCNAYLNSASMYKLALFRHKCKFCGSVIQSQFQSGRFVDINVLDQIPDSGHVDPKSIDDDPCFLFVIEANEHLYKKNVVTQIFQCLRVLSPPLGTVQLNKSTSEETQRSQTEGIQDSQSNRTKIGFILFDGQRNYIMNMSTMQLVIVSPSHFESVDEFPLTREELLQPLRSVDLEQLEQIIQELMYEAFMINSCCLIPTLKICHVLAKDWNVQSKIFALSYDSTMLRQSNKKTEDTKKIPCYEISPYVQMFVFSYGLYDNLTKVGLSNNLAMYLEYNKFSETDIYYSLYHYLTRQAHYQVGIQIVSTGLIVATNPVQTIPVITSNRSLIFDFSIPSKLKQLSNLEGKQELSNQCIQIKLKFKKFERIITYSVPNIGLNINNEAYALNDETFFYVMVSKFLRDEKIISSNKAIQLKCKEIIQRIMKSEDAQFSIPKNLINFFMYAFMMVQHQFCDKKNSDFLVQKAGFLNEGLETIVKKLYPKVYQFQPELKAVKFRPKSFLHNTIRVIDNGRSLSIVIGDDVSTDLLKQLFGLKNIDQVLELREIPVLETNLNQRLRTTLTALKELNQLYFLNVRLMRLDSKQFEEEFGSFLYIQDDHRKFFIKLLRD